MLRKGSLTIEILAESLILCVAPCTDFPAQSHMNAHGYKKTYKNMERILRFCSKNL